MFHGNHLHINGGSSERPFSLISLPPSLSLSPLSLSPSPSSSLPLPLPQALADAVKLMKETLQSAREIQSVIAQVRRTLVLCARALKIAPGWGDILGEHLSNQRQSPHLTRPCPRLCLRSKIRRKRQGWAAAATKTSCRGLDLAFPTVCVCVGGGGGSERESGRGLRR